VQEAARDRELLIHSARQLGGERVLLARELELREQLARGPPPVHHPVDASEEVEVLHHREVIEEPRLVGQVGDPALRRDRVLREIVPGDPDRPPRRGDDAGDAAERRRLAGAVRADEADDLAGADLEGDAVHRGRAAELLAQGSDLEDRQAGGGGGVRARGRGSSVGRVGHAPTLTRAA